MTDDRDEIADFADRMQARWRRGEDLDFEFEIEFASFTAAEQEEVAALLEQRIAHGKESCWLEAVTGYRCERHSLARGSSSRRHVHLRHRLLRQPGGFEGLRHRLGSSDQEKETTWHTC